MIIAMKCLDEEKTVKRCLTDFHDEDFVSKIIVVDGDSSDFTVLELKQFSKVEVHVHKWLRNYHDQEIIQSQIVLSYIPNGELFFILDFDERMSPELKDMLRKIDKGEVFIPDKAIASFSRRTFDVARHENSPHAIIDTEYSNGWPIRLNQKGQYPDYQCRLMRRFPEFHWINSPHHIPCGQTDEIYVDADILHYEKDDDRDRLRLERQWAWNTVRRHELGLPPDRWETRVKPEVADFIEQKGLNE